MFLGGINNILFIKTTAFPHDVPEKNIIRLLRYTTLMRLKNAFL